MLDQELAQVAASIPASLKIRNGAGKHILVQALGARLPSELLGRRKMGFGVPLAAWFRGPLREMLWDHLTDTKFLARNIISPSFVRGLLEEHQSGRRDNNGSLWALLMLEMWFESLERAS